MKKISFFLICSALLFTCGVFAQENTTDQNTIDQQFEELFEKSNNYQQYEVVERRKLLELQDNTRERISKLEAQIDSSQANITAQKKEIDQLQSNLTQTTEELNAAKQAKAEMAFFGIPTTKTTYRVITWAVILILILVLAIFIYKFKNSHVQTREAKRNLKETEEEFEEHRRKALEKQQKLGRQLQDERNKLIRKNQKNSP